MSLKKWILGGAAFLVLLAAAFLFIKSSPPPPIKLPNPNGYDDLVQAGQMFVGELPECDWTPSLDDECLEETKTFLKANSEVLKRVRLGLSRESRLPTEFTQVYISNHLPELAVIKRLALTLAAEGKVAEKENRMDDAIQSYLDAARLNGQMRGSVMIDALVGIAVEAIGVNPLQKLSNGMTREQRQEVIKALTQVYTNRDSFEEVLKNEKKLRSQNSRNSRPVCLSYHLFFTTGS